MVDGRVVVAGGTHYPYGIQLQVRPPCASGPRVGPVAFGVLRFCEAGLAGGSGVVRPLSGCCLRRGRGAQGLRSAELWNPLTGGWSELPPMRSGHGYTAGCTLPNGHFCVCGMRRPGSLRRPFSFPLIVHYLLLLYGGIRWNKVRIYYKRERKLPSSRRRPARWPSGAVRGQAAMTATGRPRCALRPLTPRPPLSTLAARGAARPRRRSHVHAPWHSFYPESLIKYTGWCTDGLTAGG